MMTISFNYETVQPQQPIESFPAPEFSLEYAKHLGGLILMESQKFTRVLGWFCIVGVLGFASGVGLFFIVSQIH
jgi:hypothetical protein